MSAVTPRHDAASRRGMLISAQTPCGSISVNVRCAFAAERQLQSLAQRRQPRAQSASDVLQPDAGVLHAHDTAIIAHPDIDVDATAGLARIDAMAHGVLDQRQQRHRWTVQPRRRRIEMDGVLQPIRHAHLHEIQVGARQLHFGLQRGGLRMHARHGRA